MHHALKFPENCINIQLSKDLQCGSTYIFLVHVLNAQKAATATFPLTMHLLPQAESHTPRSLKRPGNEATLHNIHTQTTTVKRSAMWTDIILVLVHVLKKLPQQHCHWAEPHSLKGL